MRIVIDSERSKTVSEIKRHFIKLRPQAHVFYADPDQIIERYGIDYAPAMWLFDKNGVLVFEQVGDKPQYVGQLNNSAHADVIVSKKLGKKVDSKTAEAAKSAIAT